MYPQQEVTLTNASMVGPLELHDTGDTPLSLTRDESAAGAYTLLALRRNDTAIAFIGLDADDNVVVYAADATTVLLTVDADGVKAAQYKDADGITVVRAQQPAIADGTATVGSAAGSGSTGGASGDPATKGDVDAVWGEVNTLGGIVADANSTAVTALTKVNDLLAALRTHGLIAT